MYTAAAAKSLQSCLTLRPHGRQPTRLPRPWDSPGKNTGVGCHFLLQWMRVKSESEVAQSCLTLRDPMDCSLPGFSVHGIFQARVPEWGDPDSIPGLGKPHGEGIGYPLQYSWASLLAQMVKNRPAMREIWIQSPGLGRSPGEGIGYPFQYSWASLLAQMVKNLPAMRETWVCFLGWEDPLEQGMATHSSILAWRIPMDRGA